MDTANTLAQTGNGFSWRRVMEVGRFYYPIFRPQMIVYPIASLFIALLSLMPFGAVAQVGLFTLSWSALPLIFEVAPCILARSGDTRIVERMIPARSSEKFTFIILYLLVAVPVMVFLMPELALRLYMKIPAIQTEGMLDILKLRYCELPSVINLMNVAGSLATVLTCLYVVYQSRTNRILKSIVAVFAVKFGIGMFGAIWGLAFAINVGIKDGMACAAPRNPDQMEDMLYSMMGSSPYMTFVTIVLILYCVLMLWLSYRAMSRRNL